MVPHQKMPTKEVQNKVFPGGWRKIIRQRLSSNAQDRVIISPNGERLRSTKKLLNFLKTHVEYAKTFDPLEIHMESSEERLSKPNRQTQEIVNFLKASNFNEDVTMTNVADDSDAMLETTKNKDLSLVNRITKSSLLPTTQLSSSSPVCSSVQSTSLSRRSTEKNANIIKNDNQYSMHMVEKLHVAEDKNEEGINAAKLFPSFRELVNDLECYFISSVNIPSMEDLAILSKTYGISIEMISDYLEKKWSGKIDFETRASKEELVQHMKNYVPSADFVDNMTNILYDQETYELELDNAENDVTIEIH